MSDDQPSEFVRRSDLMVHEETGLRAFGERIEQERAAGMPWPLHDDAKTRLGTVYFARLADGHGPIKIGVTIDPQPERRLRELYAQNPYPLVFLATTDGGRRMERILHRRFWHLRDHGEWFRAELELLDFIATLRDGEA